MILPYSSLLNGVCLCLNLWCGLWGPAAFNFASMVVVLGLALAVERMEDRP